jgi:hypothetical protein
MIDASARSQKTMRRILLFAECPIRINRLSSALCSGSKNSTDFESSQNGLGLFEPNSMFFEVGAVLLVVPLKFHGTKVFYRIYSVNRNTWCYRPSSEIACLLDGRLLHAGPCQ